MKITFSNLGAIKKTTLDLRPLTVIIGPNNSNKTYIAYSVYGILNTLRYSNLYSKKQIFLEGYVPPKEIFPLKIDKKFFQAIIKDAQKNIERFEDDLADFFQDSSGKLFKLTKFEIKISEEEIKKSIDSLIDNFDLKENLRVRLFFEKDLLSVEYLESDFQELDFIKESSSEKSRMLIQAYILGIIQTYLYAALFPTSFIMPAERNSLILTFKFLGNRRYKYLRQDQREKSQLNNRHKTITLSKQLSLLEEEGEVNYPQPLEDFLEFLTDIELELDSENKNKKIIELANLIENNINNNAKLNFKYLRYGGRSLKINVKRNLNIDLYNASSSIKQLSPLLLYLRYRAQEGDLLVIDEPEMNLHPESQAKLLEVLGMLVNAGVNVLLTTHSPYFMSHLNNLIAGDMSNESVREKQAKSLYLEDSRAFLKPEDVSAYEMKNNKLVSLKHKDEDGDYSISWETLSDVSADIQRKFFEMYEKREESSNSEEKE